MARFEAAIDVFAGALRLVLDLAAAEEVRRLDPDHHRELAALDHVPRLARVLDDPQPAAPRPAALRVDVALEPPQPLDLRRDHLRLVTGVRLSRLDLAYRLVLDRLGNDQPLPRLPHPLQPPVIDLLVRVRAVDRPAGEGRPAVGVVGTERQPVAQQVAGDVLAAVGAVEIRVVPERLGDPEAVEAAAVDDGAAGAHLGGDVEMEVGEAAHGAVAVGALEWLSACAGRRLGVGAAVARGQEHEAAAEAGVAVDADERQVLVLDGERATVDGRAEAHRSLRGELRRPLG